MIGVTAYGAYIPKLRLNRMNIVQAMGWFAPAIMAVAQGERSACNWDEDALSMCVESSRDCLTGINKRAVDALYLASTTLPYADRQNAGIVSTALNLREDIVTADFTSSLKSSTTAILAALDALRAGTRKQVLVTASDRRETKAAYFYEMWFGDGAASLLLGDENVIAEFKGSYSVSADFVDHYRGVGKKFDYMWEERWVRDEGYAKLIPKAVGGLLDRCGLSMNDVAKVVYPCFIKTEHAAIAKRLGITPERVQDNMHEVCGETGAAHPLVMFVKALEEASPGDKIVLASFGQGCDALLFEITDDISKLPPRRGVTGSLAHRRDIDNYLKFAKFRDLIAVEMGIRGEAGGQTAMSTLWRKRKMILGLVGSKCTRCGYPHFPPQEICVNPQCGAMHEMEDYEFADKTAKVIMFTEDMLAVSVEPPAIYGLIQFDGGGRMMADFTDCAPGTIKVGQSMRMSFRKRWEDRERGYHGYFWKAVPCGES